jgi:hypothetical protein
MKIYYKCSNTSYMFRPLMWPSSGRCVTKNKYTEMLKCKGYHYVCIFKHFLNLLVLVILPNCSMHGYGSFKTVFSSVRKTTNPSHMRLGGRAGIKIRELRRTKHAYQPLETEVQFIAKKARRQNCCPADSIGFGFYLLYYL